MIKKFNQCMIGKIRNIHNGFVQEELKELLAEVGFQSTTSKTFYHGKNIFAKQDASMFIASSMK